MDGLRALTLIAATMSMGLVAGVFGLYGHTIMPGLKKTDDRTFIAAFQSIDRAIINPWFLGGGFLGALVFTAVAGIVNIGEDALGWVAGASSLPVRGRHHHRDQRAPQRRDQRGRGPRSDRRPRRGARDVQRVTMGTLESRPGAHLDDRVWLPRLGSRGAWRVDVINSST